MKQQLEDPEGIKAIQLFKKAEWPQIHNIRTLQVYMIQCDQITSTEQMDALAKDLFVDPVLHEYVVDGFTGDQQSFDWYVEIGFRAGVTDNAGKVARENLELRLPEKFSGKEIVASSIGYYIQGDFNEAEINSAVDHLLMNKLIQRKTVVARSNWTADKETLKQVPMPRGDEKISVETLDCSSIDKILALSDERILALSA